MGVIMIKKYIFLIGLGIAFGGLASNACATDIEDVKVLDQTLLDTIYKKIENGGVLLNNSYLIDKHIFDNLSGEEQARIIIKLYEELEMEERNSFYGWIKRIPGHIMQHFDPLTTIYHALMWSFVCKICFKK